MLRVYVSDLITKNGGGVNLSSRKAYTREAGTETTEACEGGALLEAGGGGDRGDKYFYTKEKAAPYLHTPRAYYAGR